MAEVAEQRRAPGPDERHDLDADDESLIVLQDLQRRFGDVCRVPTETRGNESLVIHDPDDIHRVLLANRGNYVKGVGLERVRVLIGNGLILSDGEVWSRQRRMMQPAFHGQVIRGFSTLMHDVNGELIARWSVAAERGETIDLTRELSEVTLTIVLRAIFSSDLDRLIESEGENPFDLLTRESRRDLPFATRFRGLTRHVRAIIASRRREDRVEIDFLSMLMAARDKESGAPMSDRSLLDEVMTLIVAGHETTASTLNWTWYLISQHREVEAELHAAVDAASAPAPAPASASAAPAAFTAVEPLAGASYVEQVLQEGLRLYPPVWLFTRRALEDDRLGGFDVRAGTDIFISPYLLHRHAAHWDRPEAFLPARFAPEASAGRHRFAFLPFAAGPRFCIGAGFAMAEMAMHMILVARRFRLEYAGSAAPQAEFQINLRTREAVTMRLVAR